MLVKKSCIHSLTERTSLIYIPSHMMEIALEKTLALWTKSLWKDQAQHTCDLTINKWSYNGAKLYTVINLKIYSIIHVNLDKIKVLLILILSTFYYTTKDKSFTVFGDLGLYFHTNSLSINVTLYLLFLGWTHSASSCSFI